MKTRTQPDLARPSRAVPRLARPRSATPCHAAPVRTDSEPLRGYTVDSSNVEYVGWSKDEQVMLVRFNSGVSYAYFGVPYQRAVAAAHAESVGNYINTRIKPHYKFARLAEDKLRPAGTQRNALERRCPTCGAQPGEPCERIKAAKGRSHAARWRK